MSASAAGIFLAAGAVTLANEAVFAPVSSGGAITADFNWRIIPASLLGALAFGGLAQVVPGFAAGLAGLVLLTVLLVPMGKAGSPIANASKMLGY
jgi:hypothetical protein